MTDDGCFDRAAVVERVTVATALPTGAVLAAATVLWAGDVAGALLVCATGAVGIATLLYLAEGLVSRPGRLGGLDGRPVAAGRDTTRRALPGLLAASLALAVLFAVVWGVSGSPSALVAALPLGAGLDALVAALMLRRFERRHHAVVLVDRGSAWPWSSREVTLSPAAASVLAARRQAAPATVALPQG